MESQVLRWKDVLEITKLSRSTILRMVKRGTFPAPFHLNLRGLAWKREEVEQWLRDRMLLRK
ncbi:AlpA family phage regulatory protein [Salmonella enterica subsp. enterica serovar Nigeria]|nr:AlpA family phage regulatory protein [Salmonella enterica subsp. enterica serovar Nigeria]